MIRTWGRLCVAIVVLLTLGIPAVAAADNSPIRPRTKLVIEVTTSPTGPVKQFVLGCDPDVGDPHPDAKAACDALRKNPWALDPVPPGSNCLDRFFGPQTATIEGIFQGREIASKFNRRNTCEEKRWQALLPVWG